MTSDVTTVAGCVANGHQTVHHVSASPLFIPDARISRLAIMTFARLVRLAGVPPHRSAGDRCPLASPRIPVLLALEEPGTRAAKDRPGDPHPRAAHLSGQSALCEADKYVELGKSGL